MSRVRGLQQHGGQLSGDIEQTPCQECGRLVPELTEVGVLWWCDCEYMLIPYEFFVEVE